MSPNSSPLDLVYCLIWLQDFIFGLALLDGTSASFSYLKVPLVMHDLTQIIFSVIITLRCFMDQVALSYFVPRRRSKRLCLPALIFWLLPLKISYHGDCGDSLRHLKFLLEVIDAGWLYLSHYAFSIRYYM